MCGVILGVVYQVLAERRRHEKLSKELTEELRSNLYLLPQKVSTLKTIIKELEERKLLPGVCVPFCDVLYRNHYPSIAPYLSHKQRNILHVIYSNFDEIDNVMEFQR